MTITKTHQRNCRLDLLLITPYDERPPPVDPWIPESRALNEAYLSLPALPRVIGQVAASKTFHPIAAYSPAQRDQGILLKL